jgi:hypothetical protein
MNQNHSRTMRIPLTLCFFILHSSFCLSAFAQGTAFTYQGRLNTNNAPYTGTAEFQFTLWDAASGGNVVATNNPPSVITSVAAGLFMATLDFGGHPFPGEPRFLQIEVRTVLGPFNTLMPRQPLTPTPYAIQAAIAGSASTVLGLNVNTNLSSVALGTANTAGAAYATVSGGTDNTASGERAAVGGGDFNTASGTRAAVAGGYANVASGYTAALGGGLGNRVSGNYAAMGGGDNNTASGAGAFVGGGSANQATNTFATVPGGENNLAGGQYSFAAGRRARALHAGAFVWADSQNTDFASTTDNQFAIRAAGGFLLDGKLGIGLSAPGYSLEVQNSQAVGRFTTTNNLNGAVLILNNASASASYLGAINFETNGSTVGQIGYLAGDEMSFRVGGYEIASMSATGLIVNGSAEVSSLSAVEASAANLTSTELLQMHSSSQDESHTFTGNLRQMLSLAPATLLGPDGPGLGLQTNNLYFRSQADFSWFRRGTHRDTPYDPGASFFEPGVELMRLTATGLTVNGAFVSSSDRNAKENFRPVDAQAVLAKVAALPLSEWNYKADAATRHLGPMAQDFHAAFNVGPDDKHIATVDADGVALAAIQGLNEKVEGRMKNEEVRSRRLEEKLDQKETEITELKARLDRLEQLLKHSAR